MLKKQDSRRGFLKTMGITGAALAVPSLWIPRSFAAETLVIADNGGSLGPALRKAFYDPFEKETGIHITNVAHESDAVTQFKLAVDSGSHMWDIAMVTPDNVIRLTEGKNYLAPLEMTGSDTQDILPGMLTGNWFGFSVWAAIMAYRTDKFGNNGPANWKDYWDTNKFPGRRGLYRSPSCTFEAALLADGVAPADLYPLDIDRAMKSLDKIRDHINVWWSDGAQNTQLLQSGEVSLSDTWNSRALAAIHAGAPVKIVWQGTYSVDGWSIVSGTPRLAQARQFIKFCMRPDRQAEYSALTSNGPSNSKALGLMDKSAAQQLATWPENLKGLVRQDAAWWGKNYDAANERFQEWLIGG